MTFNIFKKIRGCGGTGTIVSIHNALYAGLINKIGTNEQKIKFLPDFIKNGIVGCFALSEPGNNIILKDNRLRFQLIHIYYFKVRQR